MNGNSLSTDVADDRQDAETDAVDARPRGSRGGQAFQVIVPLRVGGLRVDEPI
jgi:hypothetical protein